MRVPVKGGSATWDPEIIILTSNAIIETWYPKAKDIDIRALHRRIRTFQIPEQTKELDEFLGVVRRPQGGAAGAAAPSQEPDIPQDGGEWADDWADAMIRTVLN